MRASRILLALLALSLGAMPLLACSSSTGGGCSCGELPANCCGWEIYKKCDLIEGKRAAGGVDLCDPCAPVARYTRVRQAQSAPVVMPVEDQEVVIINGLHNFGAPAGR